MPPFYRLYSLHIVYHERIEVCNQSLSAIVLGVISLSIVRALTYIWQYRGAKQIHPRYSNGRWGWRVYFHLSHEAARLLQRQQIAQCCHWQAHIFLRHTRREVCSLNRNSIKTASLPSLATRLWSIFVEACFCGAVWWGRSNAICILETSRINLR